MKGYLGNTIICCAVLSCYALLLSRALTATRGNPTVIDTAYEHSTPAKAVLHTELGKEGKLAVWRKGETEFFLNVWNFEIMPAHGNTYFGVKAKTEGTVEISWPINPAAAPTNVWLYLADDIRGLRNVLIRSTDNQVVADALSPGRWVSVPISSTQISNKKVNLTLTALTGDDVWLKAIVVTAETSL